MADNNTLLIRKVGSSDRRDTMTDFGVVVLSAPMLLPTEVKDVGSRDWVDEHGLDVYNASTSYFKDFDVDFQLGIKGDAQTCHNKFKAFVNYLTTNGVLHDLYCPWVQGGRTGVRYKSSSDFNFERSSQGIWMTFKAKFNVSDPVTEVNEF